MQKIISKLCISLLLTFSIYSSTKTNQTQLGSFGAPTSMHKRETFRQEMEFEKMKNSFTVASEVSNNNLDICNLSVFTIIDTLDTLKAFIDLGEPMFSKAVGKFDVDLSFEQADAVVSSIEECSRE